jgi:hypothetical protein
MRKTKFEPEVDRRPGDPISLLWPVRLRIVFAAWYIGETPFRVEEMCRSGEIVGCKQGNRPSNPWTIDRLELDRYVSRRHAEAATRRQGVR